MKSWKSFMVALLVMMFAVTTAGAEPKVELKLNHLFVKGHSVGQVDEWYANELAKRTDGRVQIKIFWAQALGKAKESLALLQKGAIDMAAVSPAYTPTELPFLTAINGLPVLPIAMKDPYHAQLTANTLMEKVLAFKEETNAHNFRILYFHVLNPYYLFSKKAVRKFDDLKGLKLRSWGKDLADVMKAAGAVPVSIMLPELYENVQRGVVDGGPIGFEEILKYKFYEVGKYVTTVKMWMGITTPVMINLDKWNALPADNRKIMLDLAKEAEKKEIAILDEAMKGGRKALEAKGMEIIDFPDGELRKWISASPDVLDRWVERMKKIGKESDARKTVAIWKELNR